MALLIGFLGIFNSLYSQSINSSAVRPLKIGDTVPDLVFKNIVNYHEKEMKISDFKGKLLIIDIWNKWCSSCIAGFPQKEEFQNKFKDQLQVILLTSNSKEEYEHLKKRSKIVKNTKLPFVLSDTIVDKLFPHLGVPYHVWIDSNRVVRARTNEFGTTESNLINFFKTGSTDLVRKRDNDLVNFNFKTPLLLEGEGRLKRYITSYSVFMKSIPDYPNKDILGYYYDGSGKSINYGVRFINVTLSDLIYRTFGNRDVMFEFKGGDKYQYSRFFNGDEQNQFIKDYTYCYELLLPDYYKDSSFQSIKEAIKQRMISDLANNFGLSFIIENREFDCLNLIKTRELSFRHTDKEPISEYYSNIWSLRNYPIESFAPAIQNILKKEIKIYNKTEYSGNVTMDLILKNRDLISLNKELRKYNLQLVEGKITKPTTIVRKR